MDVKVEDGKNSTENTSDDLEANNEEIKSSGDGTADATEDCSDESFGSDSDKLNKKPHLGSLNLPLKTKRELDEEMAQERREKMQVLVSNFTEEQLNQYEMYRRAAFPKAAIKRLMMSIIGCTVSQNVVIAMSGIAKVFVGEIVENALDVMEKCGETGPVQPKHIREAIRQVRNQGGVHSPRKRKPLFKR
ncbi:TAF11 (predicted) [Pycnogonum litorale]